MTTDVAAKPPPKRSKEFANAVYDDWKRKAIDSAKKRAVAQYVDYDTFKNMVSVAHLKPIGETCQATESAHVPAWCVGKDGKAPPSAAQQAVRPLSVAAPEQLPTTAPDFERQWRRCCGTSDARYAFLRRFTQAQLQQVFKVEVKSTVLADIVTALADCWLARAGVRQVAAGPETLDFTTAALDVCSLNTAPSQATSASGSSATQSAGQGERPHCDDLAASAAPPGAAEATCGAPLQASSDVQAGRQGVEAKRGEQALSGARAHGALHEAAWVLQALRALAQSGRFGLNVRLLPANARASLANLFAELSEAAACSVDVADAGVDAAAVQETAALFGVPLSVR